jgi:hypothetical protein
MSFQGYLAFQISDVCGLTPRVKLQAHPSAFAADLRYSCDQLPHINNASLTASTAPLDRRLQSQDSYGLGITLAWRQYSRHVSPSRRQMFVNRR